MKAKNTEFGISAERIIADRYERAGFRMVAQRYRKSTGEIDLILTHKKKYYFVEVKAAKTFAQGLARILPKQIARIHATALVFLTAHGLPLNTDMRFDAAVVDRFGQSKVLAGALNGY